MSLQVLSDVYCIIPADSGPAGLRLKPPADIPAAEAEIIARLSFLKGNFVEMLL